MRKLTAILFFLLFVIGSVHTYYWYKKADEFRSALEQYIAQVNEQEKQFSPDTTFIHYDSIMISGYPFMMQLDVMKPVITLPVSAIAKKSVLNTLNNINNTVTPPAGKAQNNVVIELTYNDKISIAGNITANDFYLIASGDSTIKPIINNVPSNIINSTSSSPLTCHLGIYNADNLPWNIPASFADMQSLLTALRSVDCHISGVVSKAAKSDDVISSLDDFYISATSAPENPGQQKISFKSGIKNAKATSAYDDIANFYLQLFYEIAQVPQDKREANLNFSQYGEQNSAVDISYEGPIDRQSLLDPSVNIRFDVNALNSNNALYQSSAETHISSLIEGNDRNSSIVAHMALEANEQYERLVIKQLADMFSEIVKNPAANAPFATLVAANVNPQELATAIVPKFHTIGKVSFDADIKIKGSKDKNMLDTDSIAINAFDLVTNKYGMKIAGSGKNNAGRIPVGDLIAKCIVCDAMLEDVGEYAMGIDSILARTRAGQAMYVTRQLIDGIKQFMHAIDENTAGKDPKDIYVHFVTDDKGRITVSGKELMEVIGLFGTNVQQKLQQQPQPPQVQSQPVTPPVPVPPAK